MPPTQAVIRTAKGLYSQFNRLEAPPGSLQLADNCVIDRPGIIEKRRGFNRYGGSLSNAGGYLMKYKRRILVVDGTTIKYDSDGHGTWASYSGTFNPPWENTRIQGLECRQSFYFTADSRVQKIDSLTGTPTGAGICPGLDIQLTKTGTGGGWLGIGQVSYRIVWGRTDTNNQESIGEPSAPEIITNAESVSLNWTSSGAGPYTVTVTHSAHGYADEDEIVITNSSVPEIEGPHEINYVDANTYTFEVIDDPSASGTCEDYKEYNVILTSTVPEQVVVGDFYEIYRTDISASASTYPGDRHKLVKRVTVESADITNKYITFSDDYGDMQEDELYSNPLRETISKVNCRPPRAKYLALFKGHVWYADTQQPAYREIQFDSVDGITTWPVYLGYDSITIKVGTTIHEFKFSNDESVEYKRFMLYTGEATISENIRNTMKSFCKILNRSRIGLYAQYTSGILEQAGKVRISTYDVTDDAITIESSEGDNFTPNITNPTTFLNDRKLNGIYHSKFEKPEAVPITNVDNPGSSDSEIFGIQAIKDALIILKQDGYYMITGDTDGYSGATFTLSQLDPTLRPVAPASIVTLDNSVYALTSQGVVRSTEAGSRIASWPIEIDLNKLSQLGNFSNVTHAVSYDSDRKYILWTQERSGDTESEVGWVYNYITESWTRWKKPVKSAIVLDTEDGGEYLYLTHNQDPYILRERKTFSTADEDYTDEQIPITVTTATTTYNDDGDLVSYLTVTYDYWETIDKGWLFEQGDVEGIVDSAEMITSTSYKLTLDRNISATTGAATIAMPIQMTVQWMPESLGNAAIMKQFSEAQIYFEREGGIHTMGCCADTQGVAEYTSDIEFPKTYGWGKSAWGAAAWGDSQMAPTRPIRAWVPRNHQRARAMRVVYKNSTSKEKISILQMTLSVRPYSERTQREPR